MRSANAPATPSPTAPETHPSSSAGAIGFADLLEALRASAEPTRLRILAVLSHGALTVSELASVLAQSQPRVSRHLKLLGDAGLLDRVPEGNWVFYRLTEAPVLGAIMPLLDDADAALADDRRRLESVLASRRHAADAYFREHAHEWSAIRSLYVDEREVERLVRDLLDARPLGDLLDVGTGTGRMLELLAPHAATAVGIDRSQDMLALARVALAGPAFRHVHVRYGDMNALPVPTDSVDTAIVHQVLHFADTPTTVLRELARVLRPGGRALLVDFAPHTVDALRDTYAHRRLGFHTDELKAWCRAAGLSLSETRTLAGDPLTVAFWLVTADGIAA
jgi:ubiquinone/menaquinone biosynthesis C-methylase UbiE